MEQSAKRTSIIFIHWAMNEERSALMRESIDSIIETAPEAEIIVVDNGGSFVDSQMLLEMTLEGKIASYTLYRQNMGIAYARNDALKRASRDFVVIIDNDVQVQPGWLDRCTGFLEAHSGKYLATPLLPDYMHTHPKYQAGVLAGWNLNHRAGSNCFVMRREDMLAIGDFPNHNITGSKYNDKWSRLGYLMACDPEPKAIDLAFRNGYNFRESTIPKNL